MATLKLIGTMAEIEFEYTEDGVLAKCVNHSTSDGQLSPPGDCGWAETYDDLNDAAEYAADHADTGRR